MLSNFGAAKFDIASAVRRRARRRPEIPGVAMLRAALPQSCTLCVGASGDALLCTACTNEMPRVAAACPQCALPSPAGALCGACLAAPPPHATTIAAWCYAFPVDRLLHALKYSAHLALAEPLAIALTNAVAARGAPLPDRLFALPLSARRQRFRGFNHAQEIARHVSARTGVPLLHDLVRTRDSPPQTGLALDARIRNVRGAFSTLGRLDGLAVAIVDDVMTTGATLGAASTAARNAGARRVDAWVVARTLPPGQRTA